jgi:hypothetical protein
MHRFDDNVVFDGEVTKASDQHVSSAFVFPCQLRDRNVLIARWLSHGPDYKPETAWAAPITDEIGPHKSGGG